MLPETLRFVVDIFEGNAPTEIPRDKKKIAQHIVEMVKRAEDPEYSVELEEDEVLQEDDYVDDEEETTLSDGQPHSLAVLCPIDDPLVAARLEAGRIPDWTLSAVQDRLSKTVPEGCGSRLQRAWMHQYFHDPMLLLRPLLLLSLFL